MASVGGVLSSRRLQLIPRTRVLSQRVLLSLLVRAESQQRCEMPCYPLWLGHLGCASGQMCSSFSLGKMFSSYSGGTEEPLQPSQTWVLCPCRHPHCEAAEGPGAEAASLCQEGLWQGACQVEPHGRRSLRVRPRQRAEAHGVPQAGGVVRPGVCLGGQGGCSSTCHRFSPGDDVGQSLSKSLCWVLRPGARGGWVGGCLCPPLTSCHCCFTSLTFMFFPTACSCFSSPALLACGPG